MSRERNVTRISIIITSEQSYRKDYIYTIECQPYVLILNWIGALASYNALIRFFLFFFC